MSISQIWTAFLATLTTLAIGVVWVLAQGKSDAVLQSEGNALRAVANASLAALESEIEASQVGASQDFVSNPALLLLARKATQSKSPGRFSRSFRDFAYQGPLQRYPDLNLALVDPWGDVIAEAGLANEAMRNLAKSTARTEESKEIQQPSPALTVIEGKPFVFSVRSISGSDLRLISLAPLQAAGEGPLRRSLGSSYPGALMRGGNIAMELSGSGTIQSLIGQMPSQLETPTAGISEFFLLGKGVDRRVAVTGRLASKYRFGTSELSLLVLSPNNAGFDAGGFGPRLGAAWHRLDNPGRGLILLVALWLAGMGISVVLPRVEWILPVQRLAAALEEAPGPGISQRLAQGSWNAHFEPLVAAIGRRTLRASTHRGWQISTQASRVPSSGSTPLAPDPATAHARDGEPTAPAMAPEPESRKSA